MNDDKTAGKKLRSPREKKTRRSLKSGDGSITDVSGIRVGHAHNLEARTGCTVVLCDERGAVAGVDVRGAAPGTRETDLLDPVNLVERIHAIVLMGGSVFGLDAACGVAQFLEERGVGFDTGVARVPIVPAAVIFDLAVGDARIRPDARMGYEACERASSNAVEVGMVGAGAGATVGKVAGIALSSTGGIGSASIKLASGATIGALVVVNAFGDIVDPSSGKILAGARRPDGRGWLDTSKAIAGATFSQRAKRANEIFESREMFESKDMVESRRGPVSPIENTTLAVVATDAALTKAQARKVAAMAHDGMARAIRPIHTMFDGDTVFALSTGNIEADVTTIGAVTAELVERAIINVGRARCVKAKGKR